MEASRFKQLVGAAMVAVVLLAGSAGSQTYGPWNVGALSNPGGAASVTAILEDGTLTVSGSGAMENYSWTGSLWYSERESITAVVIGDGVTSIGNFAFDGCTGLTSITIPNSVTSIGERAISGCTGLTSITIPDSVTYIGIRAFSGCTGLTSITIPDSVTSIEIRTFSGCSSLKSITIGNSVTSIKDGAFSSCTSLKSITIPNSVTSIGDGIGEGGAFSNCTGLESVTIPVSASIRPETFVGCNGLTTLTISGAGAMANYDWNGSPYGLSITKIIIDDSVTYIGEYAFSNCTGLTSITSLNPIPPSVGSSAFSNVPTSARLYVPEDNVLAYASATEWSRFTYINDLLWWISDSTLVTLADDGTLTVSGTGAMADYSNQWYLPWYDFRNQITTLIIGGNVTSIGDYAFVNCTGLTSITIPNSVTSIGEHAFLGCTSLTSITIPNSVDSIGIGAFQNSTSLKSITIGNGVTSIGESMFSGCTGLESVTIGNSVTSIKRAAFSSCTSLKSITSLRATPPIVGYHGFYNVPATACLFVFESSISAYSSDTTGWNHFTCVNSIFPATAVLTYGQALSEAVLFGQPASDLSGVLTFADSAFKPAVAQSGTQYEMVFTHADTVNFKPVRQNVTVTVNPKPLTVTGVKAVNRPVNATTVVTLIDGTLVGVVSGDDVTFILGDGMIATVDAGINKPVTTSIVLTGADAGNYTLTQPSGITVDIGTSSVRSPDREAPVHPTEDAAVVAPVKSAADVFTAGPNIVRKSDGVVKIYHAGAAIGHPRTASDNVLTVFDATGNVINKITISDNPALSPLSPQSPANARRVVGEWDLRDARGHAVSEGTYLLRGTVRTVDGNRERVSVKVSVR